jgi:NAD-dependent SIR2 family protein deacetylase
MYLEDLQQAELLVVMGTSLSVMPFASLVNCVPTSCPRLLINREDVAPSGWYCKRACRDVLHLGSCDDAVHAFAELLGWSNDLGQLCGTAEAINCTPVAPVDASAAASSL